MKIQVYVLSTLSLLWVLVQGDPCPLIKQLNPYKSRSWIIEAVQIEGSTIQLLRGGPASGQTEQINNIMVWDTLTNNVLYTFDLDLQISQMIYCKNKRKLIVAGIHKILEIHPLTFQILNEHLVGGTHVHNVEDSDSDLLISRDSGNPFLYDIFLKQVKETLPYTALGYVGTSWAVFVNLKDFRIFVNARQMFFDRDDNYKFIYMISTTLIMARAVGIEGTNMIVSTYYTNTMQLGQFYRQNGVVLYQALSTFTDNPSYRFQDLYFINRNGEFFIVAPLARIELSNYVYTGATTVKVASTVDPATSLPTYSLVLQEMWRYRRWRRDMQFFVFDKSTLRGHSISEYEHYSYEFLESDVPQCDFDGDGVIDSYCRKTKTISHWSWNLIMGAYFAGSDANQFFHGQDNIIGYMIRDFNQTELMRISYPRLIEKSQMSIFRVKQNPSSTYKLPYDSFVVKMGWSYSSYSALQPLHSQNSGFYLYKQVDMMTPSTTDTYNLIAHMNPSTNTEKYKITSYIMLSYTLNDFLYTCIAYRMPITPTNSNGETVDFTLAQSYFAYHMKECYQLRDGNIISFFQLQLPTPIDYSPQSIPYTSVNCAVHFIGNILVCKSSLQVLEMWSLDTFQLVDSQPINCPGEMDICIHRNRAYVGCKSTIIIYDFATKQTTVFYSSLISNPAIVRIFNDILILALSNMEIIVYDLSPLDGSSNIIFQYLNKQDCCVIYVVDFHPPTNRLLWTSQLQVTVIDLTLCITNPLSCLTCEMNAYFQYDSTFSMLKQKWDRASWSTPQPELFINNKFLDNGLGTITNPFKTDMGVVQFYFRTRQYLGNIINFQKVILNLYFDNSKEQYQSNLLFDWQHDKTEVNFLPWNASANPANANNIIKIVIQSSLQHKISIQNWQSINLSSIQIICPNCIDSSLTFLNSGQVNLRSFIISLKLSDLTNPAPIYPNIQVNVTSVTNFLLENQFIGNTQNIVFNKIPFFTFLNSALVTLKNIVFSNIWNQESLFSSVNSNLIFQDIVFTQLNTCNQTDIPTKYNIIPFQNLVANNLRFENNDFCNVCLFQNIDSQSASGTSQLISLTNIVIINNRFSNYSISSVVFLKMSLVSLFTTTQALLVSDVTFQKNTGNMSPVTPTSQNYYYIQLIKLYSATIQNVSVLDENIAGLITCSQVDSINLINVSITNSQYSATSLVPINQRTFLSLNQNLILMFQVNNFSINIMNLLGYSFSECISISISESLSASLNSITVINSSFIDSLFTSITNTENEITSISLTNSIFQELTFQTVWSYIQVGLIWIKADKSFTAITISQTTFSNNYLSINYNTQKKSSLSVSIDNSISDLIISDCSFSNYHANSIVGDLYLNVKTFSLLRSAFTQILDRMTTDLPTSPTFQASMLAAVMLTQMKGTFLTIQAQQVTMQSSTFSNAVSTQGVIQIFPNNNALTIQVTSCSFNNLFATSTGTAIFLLTSTAPVSLAIDDCTFSNLWLGNTFALNKAHLYFESSPLFVNSAVVTNLHLSNIGTLNSSSTIQLPGYINSYLLYTTSFSLNIDSSVLKTLFRRRVLPTSSYLMSTLMSTQSFYSSSLARVDKSPLLNVANLDIYGNAFVNSFFLNMDTSIVQPSLIYATDSLVSVKNINVFDFVSNWNGGLIIVSNNNSKNSFVNIILQNVNAQIIPNPENYATIDKEINLASALLNCFSTECSYSAIVAQCQNPSTVKCSGRIIKQQDGSFSLADSTFANYQLNSLNGTAIMLINSGQKVSIIGSTFSSLYSKYTGGAIYSFQNSLTQIPLITISNNSFLSNRGDQLGGALAFDSLILQGQDQLKLLNNIFRSNSANIAGALYYRGFYLKMAQVSQNTFSQNKAKMAGDVYSQPEYIVLDTKSADVKKAITSQVTNSTIVISHGSGLPLPQLDFFLFYTNERQQEQMIDVTLLSQQKDLLQVTLSINKIDPYILGTGPNSDYFLVGTFTSSFNETSKTVYLSNLDLYGKVNTTAYLIITSPFIKKLQTVLPDGTLVYSSYEYIITVNFRECSDFEIITPHSIPNLSTEVVQCQTCPDLSFSYHRQVCQECPIGVKCLVGQQMSVQPGYWRSSFSSYNIHQCAEGFLGCIGGQNVFNDLCEPGYIGPMCQECDLFNVRQMGKYTRFSKSLCKLCSFNTLAFFMIIGTLILSVFLTVRAIQSNSNFIKALVNYHYLIERGGGTGRRRGRGREMIKPSLETQRGKWSRRSIQYHPSPHDFLKNN